MNETMIYKYAALSQLSKCQPQCTSGSWPSYLLVCMYYYIVAAPEISIPILQRLTIASIVYKHYRIEFIYNCILQKRCVH